MGLCIFILMSCLAISQQAVLTSLGTQADTDTDSCYQKHFPTSIRNLLEAVTEPGHVAENTTAAHLIVGMDPMLYFLSEIRKREAHQEFTYLKLFGFYCNNLRLERLISCILGEEPSSQLRSFIKRVKSRYCSGDHIKPELHNTLLLQESDPYLIQFIDSTVNYWSLCNLHQPNILTQSRCFTEDVVLCLQTWIRSMNAVFSCMIDHRRQALGFIEVPPSITIIMNFSLNSLAEEMYRNNRGNERQSMGVFGSAHVLTSWDLVLNSARAGNWILYEDRYSTVSVDVIFVFDRQIHTKIKQITIEFPVYCKDNRTAICCKYYYNSDRSQNDTTTMTEIISPGQYPELDRTIQYRWREDMNVFEIIDKRTGTIYFIHKHSDGVQLIMRGFKPQILMSTGLLTNEQDVWKSPLLPPASLTNTECSPGCKDLLHLIIEYCRQDCAMSQYTQIGFHYQSLQLMLKTAEQMDEELVKQFGKSDTTKPPPTTKLPPVYKSTYRPTVKTEQLMKEKTTPNRADSPKQGATAKTVKRIQVENNASHNLLSSVWIVISTFLLL